jgi:hypothetical protein
MHMAETDILNLYKGIQKKKLSQTEMQDIAARLLPYNQQDLAAANKELLASVEAIKVLKTKPANEGRPQLEALVKSMMSLAAFITPREQLCSMFDTWHNTYQTKYSDPALNKRLQDGSLSNAEANKIRGTRDLLNGIFNDPNYVDMDAATKQTAMHTKMQQFLQTIDQHPSILAEMVNALQKFRKENLNNFERWAENYSKEVNDLVEKQQGLLAHLRDWEKIGYMLAGLIFSIIKMIFFTLFGKDLPFAPPLPNNGADTNAITDPYTGRTTPRASPVA